MDASKTGSRGTRDTSRAQEHNSRAALRLVGWNTAWLVVGLALIGLGAEAWLRLTVPFWYNSGQTAFVPEVGLQLRPDTEVHHTNRLDFWTVSHTNNLGFLDRDPPKRTVATCHITVIGDSFVEARQVPISEKFHVRLEERAAFELPHLHVTTSAFGLSGTGQVNQLAFWDKYARHLNPNLVVLVFVPNDYIDNFPLWAGLNKGLDPDHWPFVSATRADPLGYRLRAPDPDFARFSAPGQPLSLWQKWYERVIHRSRFALWLETKHDLFFPKLNKPHESDWRELLMQRPANARFSLGQQLASLGDRRLPDAAQSPPSFFVLFGKEISAPFYQEAIALTAFGLDEFKRRAQHVGATLVVLASHRMSRFGAGPLDRLKEIAAARDIPVIEQADFIRRQGAPLKDAGWAHNDHWSPRGHRWAAQALLEYLQQNQEVCA